MRTISAPRFPLWGLLLSLLALLAFSAAGCVKEDLSRDSNPTQSAVVGPDDEGTLVSDDGVVSLKFYPGTVTHPTTFSITRLPRANYPDQPWLLSDIYQVEPARELARMVRVVIDLSPLNPEGVVMTDLYGTNALALRLMSPGGRPLYLAQTEDVVSDSGGAPRRVILHNTSTLGGFGLFLHEGYQHCRKISGCRENPEYDDTETEAVRISECMTRLGCPQDLDAMNGEESGALFLCSMTHSCFEASTCCAEPARCSTEDGDQETEPDLEDETDLDPTEEPDAPEQEEEETDRPDGDAETAEENFSPLVCSDDAHCPSGNRCGMDARLNPAADGDQDLSGICLPVTDHSVETYVLQENAYTAMLQLPAADCVGNVPMEGGEGPSLFTMRVTLDSWWTVNNPQGVSIKLYREQNLEVVFSQGTTDATGRADLTRIYPDEWYVILLQRESAAPGDAIIPTYNWGIFVSKQDAGTAPEEGEGEDRAHVVPVSVQGVDQNRYNLFAKALGFVDGMPQGYGMVMGQVTDCRNEPPYLIANATVGFMEVRPKIVGYFSSQVSSPMPTLTQLETNQNGLFVALYMPPVEILTAFVFGRIGEDPALQLLGMSLPEHLQLRADSVSIVRFNRFR